MDRLRFLILCVVFLSLITMYYLETSYENSVHVVNSDANNNPENMKWQEIDALEKDITDDVGASKTGDGLGNLRICSTNTRKRQMEDVCEANGWSGKPIDWNHMAGLQLLVDHKHKLLYCMVPKTGTTAVRLFLGSLVTDLKPHMMYPLNTYMNYTGFQRLHWLSDRKRQEVLRDYRKFIVVRHPLGKLYSAYHNKMRVAGKLNEQVLRGPRAGLADVYLHTTGALDTNDTFDPLRDTLTFEQFADLTSLKYQEGFDDDHWRTQQSMCLPCQIPYDHILRLETFEDDSQILTDYLLTQGEKGPLVIDPQNIEKRKGHIPNIRERLETIIEKFSGIGEEVIERLLGVYRNDFSLFGYGWNKQHGATCRIDASNQQHCC